MEFLDLKMIQELLDSYERENKLRVDDFLMDFDFIRLELLKKKILSEITEEDLIFLGFELQPHEKYENLYSYRNLIHLKIYFTRLSDRFELRAYRLKHVKDIFTTHELINESFIKWKLGLVDYKIRLF